MNVKIFEKEIRILHTKPLRKVSTQNAGKELILYFNSYASDSWIQMDLTEIEAKKVFNALQEYFKERS